MSDSVPGIAIVTSYNDMLSAHQPLKPTRLSFVRPFPRPVDLPEGVPAMCDGITQGRAGMELSLFSRDVIAMGTAIALSHDMFDGALMLGVCDKIVPGLLTGALAFGHLPIIFVPAGPMPSGISKKCTKARGPSGVCRRHRRPRSAYGRRNGRLPRPGTCTF